MRGCVKGIRAAHAPPAEPASGPVRSRDLGISGPLAHDRAVTGSARFAAARRTLRTPRRSATPRARSAHAGCPCRSPGLVRLRSRGVQAHRSSGRSRREPGRGEAQLGQQLLHGGEGLVAVVPCRRDAGLDPPRLRGDDRAPGRHGQEEEALEIPNPVRFFGASDAADRRNSWMPFMAPGDACQAVVTTERAGIDTDRRTARSTIRATARR